MFNPNQFGVSIEDIYKADPTLSDPNYQNMMPDIKKPKGAEYSPAEFNAFMEHVRHKLRTESVKFNELTGEESYTIAKIRDELIVGKKNQDAILGLVKKIMVLHEDENPDIQYPAIATYKGHWLTTITLFKKNIYNTIELITISVKNEKIILP